MNNFPEKKSKFARITAGFKLVAALLVSAAALAACSQLAGVPGGAVLPAETSTPIITEAPPSTSAIPPTATPIATQPAASTQVVETQPPPQADDCTDAATFVADVTVPDNSQYAPRTGFIKTWRVKNNGTCTWDNRYSLVHAGGDLLGAISHRFSLPETVAPGETLDLSVSLVSPAAAGEYRGNWQLSNPQGVHFGTGSNHSPMWVKISVARPEPVAKGSLSGFAWQDQDFDNQVDGDEMLPGVSITLASGPECSTVISTSTTDGEGRFTFTSLAAASYCLTGTDGEVSVSQSGLLLGENQHLTGINLDWPPVWPEPVTIAGWLWSDYCAVHTGEDGYQVVDGNCVPDGDGGYRANGMIEPDEAYIAGVTIRLHGGMCSNSEMSVLDKAVTNRDGRFTFTGLQPGTYCVYMNAAEDGNAAILLPGNWTFPAPSLWYQEITLRSGDQATTVNFGWDYQDP